MSTTDVPSAAKAAQVRLNRVTPSRCRVVLDNPPLNLMGPEFVLQIREIVTALENDDQVKVVVFESAVDGFFLNHSDFLAKFEDLTSIPQGPTGLEAWPDVLVRLTRAPFVSIALIRGRATGNGSELALACDMSFASREKALLSQWEVGVGLVAGGGPTARLPRVMGRGRALEVLLSADDIRGADAELLGLREPCAPRCRAGQFRRRTRNPDRLVRQVGDRQHQAPRERSQPAARRRNQSGLGRLHDLRQATSGAGKNQSPPRARAPEAWRLGRSTRILRRTAGPQRLALKSERLSRPTWPPPSRRFSRAPRRSLEAEAAPLGVSLDPGRPAAPGPRRLRGAHHGGCSRADDAPGGHRGGRARLGQSQARGRS